MQNYINLILEKLKGGTPKEKFDALYKQFEDLQKAVYFLEELQKSYLLDIDFEGNIKTDCVKLIKTWSDINEFLKPYR